MRIVFNLRDQARETTKSLGILNVSTRILAGLAEHPGVERIDVLANSSFADLRAAALPKCHWHLADRPPPRRWARLAWDQWKLARHTDALTPDWLLLPKGFSPLLTWPRCKVSAYVHDDLFGYYRRTGEDPFPRSEANLFERSLARTAQRADAVVTNSAFTRAEFMNGYSPRVPPTPIGAPLGATKFCRNCDKISSPGKTASEGALLVPVSPWPHKRSVQAIEWLRRWQDETGSRRPVHAYGALPRGMSWLQRAGWQLHPRLTETELGALQAEAAALVYFSAYEGYGLPPVEAAAAGLRVVASDLPPLRETLPASVLFDNGSFESFSGTLTRSLSAAPVPPLRQDSAAEVAARWVAALTTQGP